jgi:ABC-2 type transport system ATP-binding protein
VDEVLDLVDLTDAAGRRVGGYSTGMRQRLALAFALLGDPGTLVLDEPANGLDPLGVTWLRGLLRRLAAEGRTVLVSSHGLAELARTVDDVVVIDRGHLVARGTTAEVLGSAGAASLEEAYLSLVTKGDAR